VAGDRTPIVFATTEPTEKCERPHYREANMFYEERT
jgi:hypothetical protein